MKYKSFTWSIGILQFLAWFSIVAFAIFCLIILYAIFEKEPIMQVALYVYIAPLTIALLIQAILYYIITKGLLNKKQWARYATILLGVFMLFGFPIGTVVGILFIYGMTKGLPNDFSRSISPEMECL